MNLLFIFLCLMLSSLSINVFSANIYQWRDKEGIKQFTTIPPPISCQTPSCIKINLFITEQIKKKKVSLSNQSNNKVKIPNNIKAGNSSKTFLDSATLVCNSLNNIKEYTQVEQARKYLRREQLCYHTNILTEYTIIEKQENFSIIRIYLEDGSSGEKWVKNIL